MIDLTWLGGTNQNIHGLLERQQVFGSKARGAKKDAADRLPIPKHEQGGRFVCGPIPCE